MMTMRSNPSIWAGACLALGAVACGGSTPEVKPAAAVAPQPKVKSASDYAADAESAMESGSYAAAVKAWDAVLARDPDNAGVMYNRAFALEQTGDLDAAATAYRKALAADPSNVDAAINLGAVLKEKGELDRAIEVTEKALESDEFNSRLLNNLSVLRREKGDYAGAIAAVRKLLMRDKENIDAYKNLSLVYYDQKKYRLAETVLGNALKLAEKKKVEDPDIYVNMGMIALAREENGKAMAFFKKAKTIDADHPVANYNIGSLALGHRDYNLAADSYATVSQSWKDNYDVVVGYGYALQGKGELDQAASELVRARTLLAKSPAERPGEESNILLQLVAINQSNEEYAKALEYANEYMKLEGVTCGPEDYEGFCGKLVGIKTMIEMGAAEEEAAAPEVEAKDASEAQFFNESDEPAPEEMPAEGETPADGEMADGETTEGEMTDEEAAPE